jgi:hypothetical protein
VDKESQKLAVDSLRDWSKWLISVNVLASAGCTVVAKNPVVANTGAQGVVTRVFLVLAIAAFVCSSVLSAALVQILAVVLERIPTTDASGTIRSIGEYVVWKKLTVKHVSQSQLVSFFLGGVFLICWVVAISIPKCPTPSTSSAPSRVEVERIAFARAIIEEHAKLLDLRRQDDADGAETAHEEFRRQYDFELARIRRD